MSHKILHIIDIILLTTLIIIASTAWIDGQYINNKVQFIEKCQNQALQSYGDQIINVTIPHDNKIPSYYEKLKWNFYKN